MGLLDLFRKKTQSEIFRDEIERTYKNAVMTAIKQCGVFTTNYSSIFYKQ